MDKIVVKGARENNLKNIDIEIPKDSKQHQTFSEQEIGKGTVNTPTKAKDVAMEKVCQDLQMVVDKEKKKEEYMILMFYLRLLKMKLIRIMKWKVKNLLMLIS